MSGQIREKIQQLEKLPTISAIQPKIIEVIRKDRVSVQEVVEVIRHDQVMASRIVAMANAPAFGYNGAIKDIEQAVFILGFEAVKNIALGVALFVMFPMNRGVLKRLWAHSCATAVLADAIYSQGGRKDRGACFLAGLLHDIGRLVLMHVESDVYYREILDNKEILAAGLPELEHHRFACDHQQAGGWFLEALQMPGEIVQVAMHHHTPEEALAKGDLTAAVCLAEAISSVCDRNLYGDGQWTEAHEKMARGFGFTETDQKGIVDLFEIERKKLKTFFGF